MATQAGGASSVQMRFFENLVRSETRLYNLFNDELRTAHGLVTSQYELLRYVRDHEGPRPTDVAAEFAIGVGAVSKTVDRLEARGWLERLPNPANRRSTILALTGAGRAVVDAADTTFQLRLRDILAGAMTPAQISAASSVLALLRSSLEQQGLGTPIG